MRAGSGMAAPRVFLPTLREVERQLPVPLPRKVRILRELEFDLEEMHARFLAQGLAPAAARARALEVLVPDPATLDALGHVHMPLYRRATRHMADDRLRLFERWSPGRRDAGRAAVGDPPAAGGSTCCAIPPPSCGR